MGCEGPYRDRADSPATTGSQVPGGPFWSWSITPGSKCRLVHKSSYLLGDQETSRQVGLAPCRRSATLWRVGRPQQHDPPDATRCVGTEAPACQGRTSVAPRAVGCVARRGPDARDGGASHTRRPDLSCEVRPGTLPGEACRHMVTVRRGGPPHPHRRAGTGPTAAVVNPGGRRGPRSRGRAPRRPLGRRPCPRASAGPWPVPGRDGPPRPSPGPPTPPRRAASRW